MLDKADDLLSTGDVLLDGWPAAREWHAEYEKLSALAEKPSPVPLPTRELAAGEGAGDHEEKGGYHSSAEPLIITMNPIQPLSEQHLATLNPGIRHTVQKLREWGFDTRDSGDGKTHEFDCDLPVPFVHISVADPACLHLDMRALMNLLDAEGVPVGMCDEAGEAPNIEGCILADMSAWIHLFNVVIPEN